VNKDLLFFLIFSFTACFYGCESNYLEPSTNSDQFYFPVDPDVYRIYEVQNINFQVAQEADTSRYLIRESVIDSFKVHNSLQYLLQRERKDSDTVDWEVDSVWTARIEPGQAILVENNQPLVKLVFPVAEGKSWNGNAFNSGEYDAYQLDNVSQMLQLNEQVFENTVTVIQNDNPDTLLYRNFRKEIFAMNVGLISKDAVILKYCEEVECIGRGEIDFGRIYRMRLLEYGKY